MTDESKKRHTGVSFAGEALYIPNILSYFRLLLIPVFVILYAQERFAAALITLAASGLSDILDGRIARRYNMVTNLGKILDPVADKLTQCAMIACIASRYPAMWLLLGVHIVKELIMIWMGVRVLRKTDTVNSAIWCGKLCTGVIYAVMMLHVIIPDIPAPISNASIALCGALILMSLAVYSARYIKMLGETK